MRKSYRSKLTAMFREADAAFHQTAQTGAPLDEVTAMRAERSPVPDRRQILSGAMVTAASMLVPRRSLAIGQPRVVIVGGGAAGLSCAYRLWTRRGIQASLYEWDDRVGGRIETLRGYFANGQLSEQHAEDISSEHTATLQLASHFGLKVESTWADPNGVKDTQWFSGAEYSQRDLNKDWRDFGWKLFRDAVGKAPRASHRHFSKAAYAWDNMSVSAWVDRYVPGGLSGPFGKLCYAAVIGEYGGPPENESALNLIYLLGYNESSTDGYQSPAAPLLAGSDERWHIAGGNELLIDGLASRLPQGTVNLGHRLIALAENSDGSFLCTFDKAGSTVEAVADHVVLALPFTTLRAVDLSGATLSSLKQTAIAKLQYGTNAKIQIQVAGRPWIKDSFSGTVLTGSALDGGWDASSFQNGGKPSPTEIFVGFPGGADGTALASKYGLTFGSEQGPAPAAMVTDTLGQLEPIFPGVTAAWHRGPKLAWFNDGNIDKHLLGAYSQYNIGQYTGFAGIEGVREGNLHFAGEHTSLNFQGYIEGAVRSGLRVAEEI